MEVLEKLRLKEDKLKVSLAKVEGQIKYQQSLTTVTCISHCNHDYEDTNKNGCGKTSQIKDLEYIQTHWYEDPYSCMAGDRWHEAEGQFNCPHCGKLNRLYKREEIQKLKHLFKSIRKVYNK